MKNPEEENEQKGRTRSDSADEQSKENKETNWDEHQRIDEEGNELGPDDIK